GPPGCANRKKGRDRAIQRPASFRNAAQRPMLGDGGTPMRTLSRLCLFLFVAGICAPCVASAQCPDGTPPPCRRQTAPRVPPANSVAVLYFGSTSSDSSDSYIADGLTDEIIVRLARVQRLDVKSRNEVRRLANTRDTRTLLQQLDVAYLVSGSVQPTPTG